MSTALFRHQRYRPGCPASPHYLVRPRPTAPGEGDFAPRMRAVGTALREAQVSAVYLVHGTFVGPDAFGLLSELTRVFPRAERTIRRAVARVVGRLTDDVGNYTERYAETLESAMETADQPPLAVRLFHWSSENHHIGRADAAIRLIDELASLDLTSGSRVLLWGHSHAGNVFALVSHLLAGDRGAAEEFFSATDIYYRWPWLGCIDIPVWNRVRRMLLAPRLPERLAGLQLDIVTFGTPIRYGWHSSGYAKLLHFIHHRPSPGMPHYLAKFPPRLSDVMRGADGDYVQQLGIAGTNIPPTLFAWRAWLADRRLARLFEEHAVRGDGWEQFKAGAIVPDAGTTLLVDYGLPKEPFKRHQAGHAVYTHKEWMLFHAEEVARRFYGLVDSE